MGACTFGLARRGSPFVELLPVPVDEFVIAAMFRLLKIVFDGKRPITEAGRPTMRAS